MDQILKSLKSLDPTTDKEREIDEIVNLLLSRDIRVIPELRAKFFNLMITNIRASEILIDIVNKILLNDNFSDAAKIKIVDLFAKSEKDMTVGRRDIIHFDKFSISVFNIVTTNPLRKTIRRK